MSVDPRAYIFSSDKKQNTLFLGAFRLWWCTGGVLRQLKSVQVLPETSRNISTLRFWILATDICMRLNSLIAA